MSVSRNEMHSLPQAETVDQNENNIAEDKKQKFAVIHKLLDLERPSITNKTLQYLLQKDTFSYLVSLITQVDGKGKRPVFGSDVSEHLIASYRSAHLLASEQPSNNLQTLLEKQLGLLIDLLFDVFQPGSSGSFFHACLVFNNILQLFPDQVYHHISCDAKTIQKFFRPMLSNLEHPPIADFFLDIICPGFSDLCQFGPYEPAPSHKWDMFQSLYHWGLLQAFIDEICSTENSLEHISACVDTLLRLISRLAESDNGAEIMLRPLSECSEMTQKILNLIFSPEYPLHHRTECAKIIFILFEKMKNEEIIIIQPQIQGPPQTIQLKNQLFNFLVPFRSQIEKYLPSISEYLLDFEVPKDLQSSFPHPGMKQEQPPFTILRLYIMNILVLLINYNQEILGEIPAKLWRKFSDWIFEFPDNNIYHGLFYQLLFLVLRSDNQTAKAGLLKKKFISRMINVLSSESASFGYKSHILRYCNAIRLQRDLENRDTPLCTILRAHKLWRSFQKKIRVMTMEQNVPGLGFKVPSPKSQFKIQERDSIKTEQVNGNGVDEVDFLYGIDHGSEYAKKLGFILQSSVELYSHDESDNEYGDEYSYESSNESSNENPYEASSKYTEQKEIKSQELDTPDVDDLINNVFNLLKKTSDLNKSKKKNSRKNQSRRRLNKQPEKLRHSFDRKGHR